VLHLDDGLRQVVDPADVYYLEARDEDTRVRVRSARLLVDMRPIRELLRLFVPHGFLQIHREYVVNLRRIREIRRRDEGRDWEVKLEPPGQQSPAGESQSSRAIVAGLPGEIAPSDVSAETSLYGAIQLRISLDCQTEVPTAPSETVTGAESRE
jgi:hypothetical protein